MVLVGRPGASEVVCAGLAAAVVPVCGKVSAMLVGTLGVMSSMPSWLGVAEVRSIVGDCPAMRGTRYKHAKHTTRKEVQGRYKSPQPGFNREAGCPFPLGFFFRIFFFWGVWGVCMGGAGPPVTRGEMY